MVSSSMQYATPSIAPDLAQYIYLKKRLKVV